MERSRAAVAGRSTKAVWSSHQAAQTLKRICLSAGASRRRAWIASTSARLEAARIGE